MKEVIKDPVFVTVDTIKRLGSKNTGIVSETFVVYRRGQPSVVHRETRALSEKGTQRLNEIRKYSEVFTNNLKEIVDFSQVILKNSQVFPKSLEEFTKSLKEVENSVGVLQKDLKERADFFPIVTSIWSSGSTLFSSIPPSALPWGQYNSGQLCV